MRKNKNPARLLEENGYGNPPSNPTFSGSFDRDRLMLTEISGLKFSLHGSYQADKRGRTGELLDCAKKTKKATIPITIKCMDNPIGPQQCTKYLTKRGLKNIELQISFNAGILQPTDSCWRNIP